MNNSLDDAVRDFYNSQSLSDSQIAEIARSRVITKDIRKWRRLAVASTAICILGVFAAAIVAYIGSNGLAKRVDEQLVPVRVVGVNAHGQGCPVCSQVAPTLAELRATFEDSNVLFTELDLSTPSNRKQSELLATALGVNNLQTAKHGSLLLSANTGDQQIAFSVDDAGRLSQTIRDLLEAR